MGRNVSVERGAAFLDEKLPGWEDKIDVERLNLESTCGCVVGQLHGGLRGRWRSNAYWRGMDELGLNADSSEAAKYGFVTRGSGADHWENLTDAWRRLIERRRKA